jgi:hypothetical protein
MTPLTGFVNAVLECAAPVTQILDEVSCPSLAPDAEELRELLSGALAPLESLLCARDLLVATAVLEAAAPRLEESLMLLPHPAGRPL